jgi:hypothetical protein
MLNTRIGENYNANDVINPNDLRKRIINVDSRFRQNMSEPAGNFTFNLEHPYKNLIRLRVASVEIPNMGYTFTKKNNTFIVKALDITEITREEKIEIEPGNYNSTDLVDLIQTKLYAQLRDTYGIYLTIELNIHTARITITHNGVSDYPVLGPDPVPTQSAKPFVLDFMSPYTIMSKHTKTTKLKRKNMGLGYNLGYRQGAYKVTTSGVSGIDPTITIYYQEGEGCLDVVGDTYMLLCVNDFYTIEQRTDETYIQCLAKIIVREDKQMVIYDDGATLLSNEIIFPSPTDLKILHIKLLDPYGEVIDLCGMNFSFSLEITEVLNTSLYDFYRNYIWLGTIPSVKYKSVQGSAQPLLRGIGPPW